MKKEDQGQDEIDKIIEDELEKVREDIFKPLSPERRKTKYDFL